MVKITDSYWFDRNDKVKCFTLYFREKREKIDFKTKVPTGVFEDADIRIGYYSNLESVLEAAADHAVMRRCREYECITIAEYLKQYHSIVKELSEAMHPSESRENAAHGV